MSASHTFHTFHQINQDGVLEIMGFCLLQKVCFSLTSSLVVENNELKFKRSPGVGELGSFLVSSCIISPSDLQFDTIGNRRNENCVQKFVKAKRVVEVADRFA